MSFDPRHVRPDFPVLRGGRLVYFDSACTTLRPDVVIEAVTRYHSEFPACGERSLHRLGRRVDEEVGLAREAARRFLGARRSEEIVFTQNTTHGINIVAHSFPFRPGDVVVTSDQEHNSNLLPWQQLVRRGVRHRAVAFGDVDARRRADTRREARVDGREVQPRRRGDRGTAGRRDGTRARRTGAARRRPGRAARGARRARARRRLPRVLGPQDARPERHGAPLREARVARTAPADARRRRDRRGLDARERRVPRRARALRGRTPELRRHRRPAPCARVPGARRTRCRPRARAHAHGPARRGAAALRGRDRLRPGGRRAGRHHELRLPRHRRARRLSLARRERGRRRPLGPALRAQLVQRPRVEGTVRVSFYLYNTSDEVAVFLDALRKVHAVLA